MKQFFSMIILLLCCVVFSTQAQQIHFTDTSNRWEVRIDGFVEETGPTLYYSRYLLRDTLFNGEQGYVHYHQSGSGIFLDEYALFITEDTIAGKVYARKIYEDTSRFVLYDFNMEEGDTLYIPNWSGGLIPNICIAVGDDVLINGVPHRTFDVFGDCYEYTVIKGIGSLTHPFYEYLGCWERTTFRLNCFENNGIRPVFSDLFTNECYLSIDNREASKPTINLSPNPASGLLNISASQPGRNYPFSICDITGRQVYRGVVKEQAIVDIAAWQSGMYITRITDEKGNTTVKKFIKH